MIDPKKYGLNSRTKLIESDGKTVLLIDRKSRVIRKDVPAILDKLAAIEEVDKAKPALRITAPLCSKAEALLSEASVNLLLK